MTPSTLACPVLMTGVPFSRRPKGASCIPQGPEAVLRQQQQPNWSKLFLYLYYRQLPLHLRWWLLPLSPEQWPSPRPMPGPTAVAAFTPALPPPTSAFVVAAEPGTTQPESDLFFGDLEGLEASQRPETVDVELVEELVGEIQHIKGNSGVGSPEVRKYVDAWSPPEASVLQVGTSKEAALRALAEALYQRRPVLYLKGHAQPYPAQVLLRTVRKPSVGALSTAAAAAGLFKSPSNTVIVIKFDPQFGYADIIVDPFFTDAFIQQPSTPTYSQLLSQLPRAFVGTAVELRRVVALLTQQSMRAYASKGAACPPWRRFDAMLARWLPKRYTDEPVTHGPGAAAAAVAAPAAAAAAPAELLRRSDSSSSSEGAVNSNSASSRGWSFSLGGTGDAASSFGSGSSSGAASSVPRTVVHGFDIPAKAPAAATTAAAAAAEPERIQIAADVAPGAVVVAVAANPAAPQAAVPSSKAAAMDSVSVKLAAAAAAAAEHDSATAAVSSWQLAVGRIVEVADASDGCLSSSSSSSDDALALTLAAKMGEKEDKKHVGDSAERGLAAVAATGKPANPPAAIAADPSVQLLAAYGYSSRVVKLQNPAAAAAAAAAAGARGRARSTCVAVAADPQLPLPHSVAAAASGGDAGSAVQGPGIKRAYEPVSASRHEHVCCGFEDIIGPSFELVSDAAVACFDGGTVGKAEGKLEALGLAAAVARIRDAVMSVDVAAAVPVAGGREVWGRKVVRLDPESGFVRCGPQFGSACAS